jgi:hypothetical protein
MAVFTGWYALGTGITNAGTFSEATTYTRPAINLSGTAASGLTQNVSQITGPTGPVGGVLTKGAFFDALTNGNLIAYWDWTILTAVPANFAAVTVNIVLNSYLQSALTLSSTGGSGSSGSTIDPGSQIGTINGQPLIAATRLGIQSGALVVLGTDRIQEIGAGLQYQAAGINVALLDTNGNPTFQGSTTTLTSTGKLTIAAGGTDLLITVGGTAVAALTSAGALYLKGTLTSGASTSLLV